MYQFSKKTSGSNILKRRCLVSKSLHIKVWFDTSELIILFLNLLGVSGWSGLNFKSQGSKGGLERSRI